ncbi:hypothetical protein TSTA_057800 [Talaromyces stipitatus ATCC 10500]|uniref:Starter acyltransferase (SAT) domain-containing protein n=1 Tax=Talaromyces stipitatus (strain ATCC 10500 / CBS 375.48 / QM 6759 / NRRL 1006) TaxID=441959 RepID=B8MRV7_TALSN|nr:uncharacterized protein TSTA_057800 [Talaromyces stipitatus ATCC 10500]EED13291.1 hypothetical protein TSTA_057800 [Talaromyces stipitatus ATCC 10500]
MAVTRMFQLGTFISVLEAGVLGLCTEAFSAAAVSCSYSTVDLVPLAVDAVTAKFRTGIVVTEIAQSLATCVNDEQS